jgi:hypothetical protein
MKDSKLGDPMMRAIVFVWIFGLLETLQLWGDHIHHWHGLGFWRMGGDFFVLPGAIFV